MGFQKNKNLRTKTFKKPSRSDPHTVYMNATCYFIVVFPIYRLDTNVIFEALVLYSTTFMCTDSIIVNFINYFYFYIFNLYLYAYPGYMYVFLR
jgi:hypothetical protein